QQHGPLFNRRGGRACARLHECMQVKLAHSRNYLRMKIGLRLEYGLRQRGTGGGDAGAIQTRSFPGEVGAAQAAATPAIFFRVAAGRSTRAAKLQRSVETAAGA